MWEYEAAGLTLEQVKAAKWISCSERMPEPEQEVEITYVIQYNGTEETRYYTTRAFYEDGTVNVEDSEYLWENDVSDFELDEESGYYLVPKGWYESLSFVEQFEMLGKGEQVTAWRPLAEPYTGKES